MMESNKTALAKASQTLDARKDDQRRHKDAAEQAVSLEQTLQKARVASESTAAKKQTVVTRAKRRCQILDEHIKTLNESMSENVTTAVSAWLQEKEVQSQESADTGGWASRLLKAAKEALVSIVGSLESFLEKYVMSLSDRESAAELVRAVEDRTSARLQLHDAEKVSLDADAQVRDATQSERKSEVSRRSAEEALRQAADAAMQAEAVVIRATKAFEESNSSLTEATKQWEVAHGVFVQREKELQAAVMKTAEANTEVDRSRERLKVTQDRLEFAKAELVEATAAVLDANVALEAAAVGSAQMYLAELQDTCGASEEDFDMYMQHVDSISLLHALVAQRGKALALAQSLYANSTASHTDAQAAHRASRTGAADARELNGKRASEAELASRDFAERLAERNGTATRLAQARERLRIDVEAVGNISVVRNNASSIAQQLASELAEADKRANATLWQSELKRVDLRRALNGTNTSIAKMQDAEEVKRKAKQAWSEAKIWFEEYVASLLLGRKQQILEDTTAHEKWRHELEVNATKRELRMKFLLGTHQRHLRNMNTELQLDDKNAKRVAAKELFEWSEKETSEANKLLLKLSKEETDCHDNIATTYSDLQRLLKGHEDATKAYNEQDPKERERSFSTNLEGSGA
mmetsp:Transcript_172541/g.547780  ORF Transcript_172541/g.547780 Transcript_172541/m.547780 type:complete len:642 (+) Transcript_172541:433-2358(+)